MAKKLGFLSLPLLLLLSVFALSTPCSAQRLAFDFGGPNSGLGDFRGVLADDAPPDNASLHWQVGVVHNVSWTVTWNQSVDLLLVSELEDQSWNNFTVASNFDGNITAWNVSLSRMPPPPSPPLVRDVYFFLLRESGGPVLIFSQNITITDARSASDQANATASGTPGTTATVTATATATPQAGTLGADASSADAGRPIGPGAIAGIAVALALAAGFLMLVLAYLLCVRRRRGAAAAAAGAAAGGGDRREAGKLRSHPSGLQENPLTPPGMVRFSMLPRRSGAKAWPLPDTPVSTMSGSSPLHSRAASREDGPPQNMVQYAGP